MPRVVMFHRCVCGATDSVVTTIEQFDLHCRNASYKFVGLEDDQIMLEEIDKSDSCPKCRKTHMSILREISPLRLKAIAFANANERPLTLREWQLLNAFVEFVDRH